MNVFFYGLFMDAALLTKKGITPRSAEVGYVDEFALRIGERATLVSSAGARSYGVMMNISSDQAEELYSDKSVADYVPESVIVELSGGSKAEAKCYNSCWQGHWDQQDLCGSSFCGGEQTRLA